MEPNELTQVIVRKGATVTNKNSMDVFVEGGRKLNIDESKISEIIEQVATWRKANAVHSWFVQNVQDGEDDCREYFVSIEQIEQLVSICKQVIAGSKLVKGKVTNGYRSTDSGKMEPIIEDGEHIEEPSLAAELLPTTSGFFFGSTEYDQWYFEDLKYTVEALEPLIEKNDQGEYKFDSDLYYRSSW